MRGTVALRLPSCMTIKISSPPKTREQINVIEAVIHCKSVSQAVFVVECSSPFVRLAQDLPALGAWCIQNLPGRCKKKTDVLRPALWGSEGLWPYEYDHAEWHKYPPTPVPLGHPTTATHGMGKRPPQGLGIFICVMFRGCTYVIEVTVVMHITRIGYS